MGLHIYAYVQTHIKVGMHMDQYKILASVSTQNDTTPVREPVYYVS